MTTATLPSRREARYWGWLVASGVIGIIAGVLAVVYPGITILVLALLLGAGLLIQGVLEVTAGIRAQSGQRGRVWMIVFGVLTAVAGLICLFSPGVGIFTLLFGLALWFLVAGITDLALAFSTPEHRGWNIALGILGIIAAITVIALPGVAIGTVALIAGIGFVLRGALDIGLGLTMRKVLKN